MASNSKRVDENDWIPDAVESALDEVLAEIEKGSLLPLTDDALQALRDRYRPDFTASLAAGAEWEVARENILPLARVVGNLASTFMVLKFDGENVPLPTFVDVDSALFASDEVAKMSFCPAPDEELGPRGKFCQLRADSGQGEAAAALRAFVARMVL